MEGPEKTKGFGESTREGARVSIRYLLEHHSNPYDAHAYFLTFRNITSGFLRTDQPALATLAEQIQAKAGVDDFKNMLRDGKLYNIGHTLAHMPAPEGIIANFRDHFIQKYFTDKQEISETDMENFLEDTKDEPIMQIDVPQAAQDLLDQLTNT